MLARKSLLIFLTNGFGAIAGLAALFFVGRYMGTEPWGILFYTLGIVGVFGVLGNLGFDTAHVKRISEGRDLGDATATFVVIKLVLVAAFAILLLGGAWVWEMQRGFVDTNLGLIAAVAAYQAAIILRMIPAQTFTGLQLAVKSQAMLLVEHVTRVPLVIAAALMYGLLAQGWVPFKGVAASLVDLFSVQGPVSDSRGALWLAWAFSASMVASLFAGLLMMWRYRYPIGRFDWELCKSYIHYALPLAILATVGVLAGRLDTFMVGFFWSATDAGFYATAQRLTSVVTVVPTAVATMFFPLVTKLAQTEHVDTIHAVAQKTQRMMSLVVVFIAICMLLFADQGIHIFLRDSFLPAADPVRIMGIATLILAFLTVPASIGKAYERPKEIAAAGIASFGTNVVLNFIFIPDSLFGVPMLGMRSTGAALATAISFAIYYVLLARVGKSITGRSLLGAWLVKHALAAVVTMTCIHLAIDPWLFGADRWYELMLAGTVTLALYLGILAAMREVTMREVRFAYDLMHPGRMTDYITNELRRKRA